MAASHHRQHWYEGMQLYVGVTDYDWFRFLQQSGPEEVNFWKPGGKATFKAIPPGAPFLFKLHSPRNYIVGGGFFTGFVRMSLRDAWETFGVKNGAPDYDRFSRAIRDYKSLGDENTAEEAKIGCIMLNAPFFFREPDWIPVPSDWAGNIVQGKRYDASEGPGRELWQRVTALLQARDVAPVSAMLVREQRGEYAARAVFGREYLRFARLGQGAFRALTLENYQHRCCITGENTTPVLQAAHIRPVTRDGTHALRNGLLLRADLHILYDQGLIGVTPDYHITVSPRIRDQFLNGKVYYAHQGAALRSLPDDPGLRPDPDLLGWHMTNVYVKG